MFSVEGMCWLIWDIKAAPLADCEEVGRPNLGMIPCINTWTTSADVSEVVGKASTHPEKVSANVSRYLVLLIGGI